MSAMKTANAHTNKKSEKLINLFSHVLVITVFSVMAFGFFNLLIK